MNEAEIENKPVEEEAMSLDMDDFTLDDEMPDQDDTTEDTVEPVAEEVDTPVETKEVEVDYKPLLDSLSGKIKYMDEEVKIESIDDLITNYQKGLDYDRKTKKIEELESSEEMSYIKEKSKEAGMTPTDYIKAIKGYEEQQAKQEEETEIAEMIDNGIAENIARKVVETNKVAKELAAEKLKLQEEQTKLAKQKERENSDKQFIAAHPDLDIKSIPKEVFIEAEKIGLDNAYSKYENAKLKNEIKILRQNQNNKETSPVKSTTEHGGVAVEQEDDFMRGFNSK